MESHAKDHIKPPKSWVAKYKKVKKPPKYPRTSNIQKPLAMSVTVAILTAILWVCSISSALSIESPHNLAKIPQKTCTHTPEEHTHEVEARLDGWVLLLQSFAPATGFNRTGFETQAQHLQTRLHKIETMVSSLPPSRKINAQLSYAKHTFSAMANAAELLRTYSRNIAHHHLLRHVVQLNVRLLALYDSHGNPPIPSRRVSKEVRLSRGHLGFWESVFCGLNGPSPDIRMIFFNQLHQAQKTLGLFETRL